jgi:hypothetical protein
MRTEGYLTEERGVQLARALRALRASCEDNGYPFDLEELLHEADLAKHGHLQDDDRDEISGSFRCDRCGGETRPMRYLTQTEFADAVGKTPRTIHTWIKRGKVTTTPLGIPEAELERLKEAA